MPPWITKEKNRCGETAGTESDRRVAKACGATHLTAVYWQFPDGSGFCIGEGDSEADWRPSISRADAIEAADRFCRLHHWKFSVSIVDGRYQAMLWKDVSRHPMRRIVRIEDGPSVPLAVTRVILSAFETDDAYRGQL